ncbi:MULTISPECIES: hypothetical protein [unclassified Streptomyces]|uniref:hypothetical protein n=1 Tax=unclassified Streptomyces TaxID=2593676 RepID=UPI001FD39088|nr:MULTISPECIES: hypothetical protein [unclassified Streptomyces]MDH3038024.1 hypothetical protein [Streptomyces sp. TRM75561]
MRGSTDGSAHTTPAVAREHRFDPATGTTGNTVTVPVDGSLHRLRLRVTGNTGRSAARFSEVDAYRS